MSKKLFRSTCLVALLVFFLNLVLILGVLYQNYEKQAAAELASEARYIAQGIALAGDRYWEGLITGEQRVTLIAPDGLVLHDSNADPATMGNHLDREEVREAMESGSGSSQRQSETLMEKNIYYALRLDDGSILRLSYTSHTVATMLVTILQPICAIILLALLLAAFLSSRVSKSILDPINKLDLDHPEDVQTYEELTPLLSRIARQQREIQRQLKQARKQEEEFRLITENMREGFLVIDSSTNLLTYNNAALRLLGIQQPTSGSVLHLNRTGQFRQAVEEVLAGKHGEYCMDQEGRTYRLIANAVGEEEKIIGAVIVILDVTEENQREKLRREFTSNVSHELKTPLTSISGFAELMKVGGMPGDVVKDFAQSIYEEAQRLITLVSDIIKLSQLDEGALPELEPVNLYQLAEETLARLKADAARQQVSVSLTGDNVTVTGVPAILSEMLYNLCDNAIKYNREGGTVEVILEDSPSSVALTVRDTGIGIPEAYQERVFERFYRVDKSHSKAIGGTGLGLSIVKHGAICHDAQVKLESVPDEGTAITITFPKV